MTESPIKENARDLSFVRQTGTELPTSPPTEAEGVKPPPYSEVVYTGLLEQQLPQIRTVGDDWYAYQGGKWELTGREAFRPKALEIIPKAFRTEHRAKSLLNHLEGKSQIPIEKFNGFYKFDHDGSILINVANGLLRVKSSGDIEHLPYNEEHGFTQQAAASYMPNDRPELFYRVMNEALPDKADQDLFQLCVGNFLYPDCRFETALVCYGEAGQTKSTISEPIAEALGPGLVQRLSMSQICDPKSYSLGRLRFAAVNLGTELDAVAVDESSNFKTLVSGEDVEARPIYGKPFTLRTTAKLWFLANGLPRFKNGTVAEQRRTRFIAFGQRPKAKDVTLKARLRLERNAVFNFMLDGLRKLMTIGEIPMGGGGSKSVHERFGVSNDPLGTFITRRCVIDPSAEITKKSLSEAFTSFCAEHGLPPELDVQFFRRLYERYPQLKATHPRAGDDRVRMVSGIILKSEENEPK